MNEVKLSKLFSCLVADYLVATLYCSNVVLFPSLRLSAIISYRLDQLIDMERTIMDFLFSVFVFLKPDTIKHIIPVFIGQYIIMETPYCHIRPSRHELYLIACNEFWFHNFLCQM